MSAGLVPIDAASVDQYGDAAKFVELACGRALEWLGQALEHGDIDAIVDVKSWAELARTRTVQMQLGKEAELAAAEIVRRAERALAVAVKNGQEEGIIKTVKDGGRPPLENSVTPGQSFPKPSARDLFSGNGRAQQEAYDMAGTPEDEFEAAVAEAKAEGNLSRTNILRKVKTELEQPAPTPAAKLEEARQMAADGYTSRQIGAAIGIKSMSNYKAKHNLVVPADKVVGKTHHHNSNRIVTETVNALEGLAMGVALMELDDLDRSQVEDWATSLSNSLRSLNRLAKQLKEMAL